MVGKLLVLCCLRKACDTDGYLDYLVYAILAYLTEIWLLGVLPVMFLIWILVVFPVLACMNCHCKVHLRKLYTYIDKVITAIFWFVTKKEVEDDDMTVNVSQFVVFGYLAPPVFTLYLFFLCVVTACYALAAFWSAFLIDMTDICNPYDDYNCFTAQGEMVSKPIERPSNSSQLTCFNQTPVNCFKFVYNIEEGITMAASVLTLSWIIILCLIWLVLKCSGGQSSGCFLHCRCCPKGRCWCSCGCRCIITVLFQVALFIFPHGIVLLPFYNKCIALFFENYLNVDTTGDFLSSDSIRLLHIASLFLFGVFVPWCWFKRQPPGGADCDEEEEEVTRTEGRRVEEGPADAELQEPIQVCVSGTEASESLQLEVFPV